MVHRNFASNVLVFIGITLIATAVFGSNIPRSSQDVATVKRFCTGNGATTPNVGLQCAEPVYILTGKKLSDGGTVATSDGGAPITPIAPDAERVIFPANVLSIGLAPGEKCVGVVSADAGTNICTFFDSTGP